MWHQPDKNKHPGWNLQSDASTAIVPTDIQHIWYDSVICRLLIENSINKCRVFYTHTEGSDRYRPSGRMQSSISRLSCTNGHYLVIYHVQYIIIGDGAGNATFTDDGVLTLGSCTIQTQNWNIWNNGLSFRGWLLQEGIDTCWVLEAWTFWEMSMAPSWVRQAGVEQTTQKKYSGHSSRKWAIHVRGTVSRQTSPKMGRLMLAPVNESATF